MSRSCSVFPACIERSRKSGSCAICAMATSARKRTGERAQAAFDREVASAGLGHGRGKLDLRKQGGKIEDAGKKVRQDHSRTYASKGDPRGARKAQC
jgi:hypothetical protein